MPGARVVLIDYTNHRGERAERMVRFPDEPYLRWERTEHHPEPQFVIDGWDIVKGQMRTFAMQDIHAWRPL